MPDLSRLRWLLLPCSLWLLGGCASTPPDALRQPLDRLLPADALLLGEQHDAPDHQRIARAVVQQLAARGQLATLALEMAEQGTSTQGLPADASETQVRTALQWNDPAWPWQAYGPVVMAAVRAGVPVLGANLPRAQLRERMADASLDDRLPAAAWQAQQAAVRSGHCDLLPPSQIAPMTRIQVARDLSMAATLQAAAVPGRTVVLLAGSGHVDRQLGVPRHLPAGFDARAIRLGTEPREAAERFDATWPAIAAPARDYCTELKRQWQR
jgi:uncharacterized iron-regulated protein